MKPIILWIPGNGSYLWGYWACRNVRYSAYKSGVGHTPKEAYDDWAHQNGVWP